MEHISISIRNIDYETTAHNQGLKKVFLRVNDTPTKVTQVAYGEFSSTDYCELHTHMTMEECFFFMNGTGTYTVGNQKIDLYPGVFVRIPAGIPHRLEASDGGKLKYVYFGVATD